MQLVDFTVWFQHGLEEENIILTLLGSFVFWDWNMEFFPWSGFKKKSEKMFYWLMSVFQKITVSTFNVLKMDKSEEMIVCLLYVIKIAVFIGKYDPVTKSLIKICLKPGVGRGHVSLLTAGSRSIG